jgi:hypothetical protein
LPHCPTHGGGTLKLSENFQNFQNFQSLARKTFSGNREKPTSLQETFRNFTPVEIYSSPAFFVPNFASAIGKETMVAALLDMLIQTSIYNLQELSLRA